MRWVADGHAGAMAYMTRDPAARAEPSALSPGATTALVTLAAYPARDAPQPGEGRIARYARSRDYHVAVREALDLLARRVMDITGRDLTPRLAVDTSPLLERELAVAAGLGFFGKNSMLITPGVGSYTVIGVMLLPLAASPAGPRGKGCGRCRRCIDACPTGALREPYLLDARRCISYLTIEHRGEVPPALAGAMGGWIFGCDLCQEACPYNARAPGRTPSLPGLDEPLLPASLPLDTALRLRKGEHNRLARGTAIRRVSRHHLRRNAALAAGSLGPRCPAAARDALCEATRDPRPLVSVAAQWALGQLS